MNIWRNDHMLHSNKTFLYFALTLIAGIVAGVLISGAGTLSGICAALLVFTGLGKVLSNVHTENFDCDTFAPAF